MRTKRVLIADDSALMRQTLRRLLEGDPELKICGAARDGEDVLNKARELRPDVITMDINMPKLDGISALQHVVQEKICPVVMVSSLTQAGAVTTFECLELGAFDFVAKPDGTVSGNMGAVAADLIMKVKAAASAVAYGPVQRRSAASAVRPPATAWANTAQAVAIGVSTGGPATLSEILPLLPADLPAPVFLVQHMPATFLTTFARRLDGACALRVVEAEAGMRVEPGTCYVAPGGLHLCLHRRPGGEVVIRTPSRPAAMFVPSVDVMMASVLEVYGEGTVGVLLTGIGRDGADQMVKIVRRGGYTIAESAETAVVYGMPREAAEAGGASVVLPSYAVASEIVKALGRKR